MKANSVFKTEEGREKILAYYNGLLAYFPLVQRTIKTTFGKTFILEAGTENHPPMVLLHGSCSNSAAWLGDIPLLAEHCHIFAIDIIGEPGNSEDNRLETDSNGYATWLKETLEALGLRNVHLVGNSFGGWLALKFATTYPKKVSSISLLAPSGILEPKKAFLEQTANVATNITTATDTTKSIIGNTEIPKEVLAFMGLVMEHFIPMTGALPVFSDMQMQALHMPILYIAGTEDITMDTKKAEQRLKALLPQVETHLNKGSHVITTAAAYILPFLAKEK